jgi:DNA-binding transcriptional regulator YbjK
LPRDAAQIRLTEAAFVLMTKTGTHGVTSRAVGALSGVKASGVNYYFGGREGLLTSTFELTRVRAGQWRERWLSSLTDGPPIGAFQGWFAMALQDHAFGQAPIRSVLRELSLDAARSPLRQSLALAESEAADGFWAEVLKAFSLDATRAGLVADFASGMATLHTHRPGSPLQLAWFAETCARFSARIVDPSATAGWDGWRLALLERPSHQPDGDRGAALLPGAVAVVGRHGLGGLTHRAVAREAGVSLAAVTGRFPTRAALVQGVFEALQADLLREPPLESLRGGPMNTGTLALGIAGSAISPDGAPTTTMLAIIELLGAAGRDPQLLEGLLVVRAGRGETTLRLGSAMLAERQGARQIDSLDAHTLSTLSFGAIPGAFARDPAARQDWLIRRIHSHYDWLTG